MPDSTRGRAPPVAAPTVCGSVRAGMRAILSKPPVPARCRGLGCDRAGHRVRHGKEAAMRVALVTSGTRGDAQPLVLLARELQARGHDPVLGLPPNVADLGR